MDGGPGRKFNGGLVQKGTGWPTFAVARNDGTNIRDAVVFVGREVWRDHAPSLPVAVAECCNAAARGGKCSRVSGSDGAPIRPPGQERQRIC